MKGKKRFYGIAFLLLALMLCKISAFHVYTHDNEPINTIENCSVCDVALENQQSDLSVPVNISPSHTLLFVFFEKIDFDSEVRSYDSLLSGTYYCRPPPLLV